MKSLHQESESNTKPSFILGHSAQAVSVLAKAANTMLAVPLNMKIHEGVIFSNRDKRTLLDKLLIMIGELDLAESFYMVADSYYGSGKLIKALLKDDNQLTPSLQRHYSAFITTTGPSAPVPCIGTLALAGSLLELLP